MKGVHFKIIKLIIKVNIYIVNLLLGLIYLFVHLFREGIIRRKNIQYSFLFQSKK